MSQPLMEKINIRRFITLIVLLLTIKVYFVHAEMSLENNENNAVLLQKSVLSEKLTPGNEKELTVLAVNFSIKYVILDPADVVKYGLNAAINPYLDKKLVDLVPIPRPQNVDTMKHMELIIPFWMDPSILLQPYPKEESHLDVIKKPFELPVWLSVLATTAGFVLISAIMIQNRGNIINDQNSSRQPFRKTIYNQLDFVFRLFTNQGTSGTHAKTRTSFKILTAIWLLSIVVLINAYSGVLTSLLTVTKLEPIAQTMNDVAESKELRVTVEKSSIYFRMFMNATKGYEKILGDQLLKEPALVVPDAVSIPNNVIQYNAAYPGSESLVKYMIKEDTKRNGHCRMTFSTYLRAYSTVAWQYQLPIGSPYAIRISKAILHYWDSGLAVHDREEYFSKSKDECRVDKPMETKKRAFTLIHLSPAFLILGVGFSLSAFCFVIEIVSKYVFIWATGKVYNTEQSLQPLCESRPGTGRVETSATAPTTAYTLQCEELGEEIEDGSAQWIRVPVASTDGMQEEGAHRDTDCVETSATAAPTAFKRALVEKTGNGLFEWIEELEAETDRMQGEEVHRDTDRE